MRAGRRNLRAAAASSGWIDMSSLPPNPPPTADGMMRTRDGLEPEHPGEFVAIHVGRLRAGEHGQPLGAGRPAPLCPARLGLDVRVLDVAGAHPRLAADRRRRPAPDPRRRGPHGHGRARCPASARAPRARPRRAPGPDWPRPAGDASGSARRAGSTASTARRGPTSTITASPRKRVRSSASAGWSRRSEKIAKRLLGMSAAVSTPLRPVCATNARVSPMLNSARS